MSNQQQNSKNRTKIEDIPVNEIPLSDLSENNLDIVRGGLMRLAQPSTCHQSGGYDCD
ncbi:MAG: hypothetical protein HC935_05295 [Pseudanabaena sp. SU_2_4]|nr:hypothetical protein [Pseudanabaena sp. SU_2_4]